MEQSEESKRKRKLEACQTSWDQGYWLDTQSYACAVPPIWNTAAGICSSVGFHEKTHTHSLSLPTVNVMHYSNNYPTSSVISHVHGHGCSPKLEDQVSVAELLGETYSVVEECVIMAQWWMAEENQRNLKINMLHCQLGLHESYKERTWDWTWQSEMRY